MAVWWRCVRVPKEDRPWIAPPSRANEDRRQASQTEHRAIWPYLPPVNRPPVVPSGTSMFLHVHGPRSSFFSLMCFSLATSTRLGPWQLRLAVSFPLEGALPEPNLHPPWHKAPKKGGQGRCGRGAQAPPPSRSPWTRGWRPWRGRWGKQRRRRRPRPWSAAEATRGRAPRVARIRSEICNDAAAACISMHPSRAGPLSVFNGPSSRPPPTGLAQRTWYSWADTTATMIWAKTMEMVSALNSHARPWNSNGNGGVAIVGYNIGGIERGGLQMVRLVA